MPKPAATKTGITGIAVKGFKSLAREVSVELAPLTILAGANSSGKSSILQPLLLLKQTLEAPYDPGSLLLSGPNVNFTSASQFLSKMGAQGSDRLEIAASSKENGVHFVFERAERTELEITSMEYRVGENTSTLRPGMTDAEIRAVFSKPLSNVYNSMFEGILGERSKPGGDRIAWQIRRERCYLALEAEFRDGSTTLPLPLPPFGFTSWLKDIIHLPGLRGIPARTYPVTAVEASFPGTFQEYTASVISQWQHDKEEEKARAVGNDLRRMGLACRVLAHQIEGTQVDVRVSRLPYPSGQQQDDVSIADVGLGLSQVLPLVVALHAASRGQLVYFEQPEIHLHPRAQREFAHVLVEAVHRGVRAVVETHSSLLLLGIQTAVAEGTLNPLDVRLHWFQRDEEGITSVRSGSLDAAGAFGDWPEDFADVELESESRYMNAADQLKLKVQ